MRNKLALNVFMLLAIGGLLFLNSCSQLRSVNINKTYSDIAFTIPSPQLAGDIVIEEEVQADLQDLASQNGFDISKIESASVKSITLKIADTSLIPYTFAIVDKATCSLYADGATVAVVGSEDATHDSPTEIHFDLSTIDVAQYLKATSFKVKLNITTNSPITHDVPMLADLQCTFKVKPLK